MAGSLLRTDKEITEIYQRHVDTVYRLCFSFMKNRADTEDMVQETFLRLMQNGTDFQSPEHEKAWLIVTASNLCKNALRHWWRKSESLEAHTDLSDPSEPEISGVLEAILRLPVNYKTAVYLYYYEGYSTPEIASMLRCPKSTVRSWLLRARKLLKQSLGGDD